jgi:NADP-dependent 3-hydroxy acid dehydrogenase YdfG
MAAAPNFDLCGRVALVNGASSGIGVRYARIPAVASAEVMLAARRTDRVDELRTEINADRLDCAADAKQIEIFLRRRLAATLLGRPARRNRHHDRRPRRPIPVTAAR